MKRGQRRRAAAQRVRDHVPTLDDAKRFPNQWLVLKGGLRVRLEVASDRKGLKVRAGQRPCSEACIDLSSCFPEGNKAKQGWPGNIKLEEIVQHPKRFKLRREQDAVPMPLS